MSFRVRQEQLAAGSHLFLLLRKTQQMSYNLGKLKKSISFEMSEMSETSETHAMNLYNMYIAIENKAIA